MDVAWFPQNNRLRGVVETEIQQRYTMPNAIGLNQWEGIVFQNRGDEEFPTFFLPLFKQPPGAFGQLEL